LARELLPMKMQVYIPILLSKLGAICPLDNAQSRAIQSETDQTAWAKSSRVL
jgi:hypothetical protein